MEMTLNQYISQLNSILETAIYNYEIDVLAEDASETDPETAEQNKSSKWEKVKKIASAVLNKIWVAIRKAVNFILSKVIKINALKVPEDMDIYEGVYIFDHKLMMYADKIMNGYYNSEFNKEVMDYIHNLKKTKHLKKGQSFDVSMILNAFKKYDAALQKLEKITYKSDNEMETKFAQSLINAISGKIREFVADCKKLIYIREDQKAEKLANTMGEKRGNAEAEKKKAMGESIDIDTFRASLLIEAARILAEDAEDNVSGIEGGEGTQKAIEDIPEETPVVDDEYPADDVTGGEGEKLDYEEIKDLVGNDNEAMAILTDDEGSKTVTESVIIHF